MLTVADATMDTAFASCSVVATSDSRRCGLGSTLFVCRDLQSHPHVKLDDSYWLLSKRWTLHLIQLAEAILRLRGEWSHEDAAL